MIINTTGECIMKFKKKKNLYESPKYIRLTNEITT